MTDTKNPFDFTDTSDLPEALAKKLKSSRGRATSDANVDAWVGVVEKAKEFGRESVGVSEIMAAAHRMGIVVPTGQTVRKHLNTAVEQGKLRKASRQSYAIK